MEKCCLTGLSDLQQFVDILQVIAEPNRIKILCILTYAYEAPKSLCNADVDNPSSMRGVCVGDLVQQLDKPQSLISHHLWMLKRIQMVKTQRRGRKIYYLINEEYFSRFKMHLQQLFHIQ